MKVDWIVPENFDCSHHFSISISKNEFRQHLTLGAKLIDMSVPAEPVDPFADVVYKLSPAFVEINEDGSIEIVKGALELYYGLEDQDEFIHLFIPKESAKNLRTHFKSIKLHIPIERHGKKYIYGKSEFLSGLLDGTADIRFTDIHYYAELENDTIRDDESKKILLRDPPSLSEVKLGDISIPRDQIKSIEISINTRRCHCLCLSNTGNSNDLYDRFGADVCIEFDVDAFLLLFEFSISGSGICVRAENIQYYDINSGFVLQSGDDAVFAKLNQFAIEDEFRIAIFYPFDEYSKLEYGQSKKEMMPFGDSTYIPIGIRDASGQHAFIGKTYRRDELHDIRRERQEDSIFPCP